MPAAVHHPVAEGVLVLGPPRLAPGGSPVPVGSRRETIVLAMLALSVGAPVPVARLVDAVWPGDPPATARTQLQICVSALRRRLVDLALPARVTTTREGYKLDLADDHLDLRRFGTAVAAARVRARTDDLEAADDSYSSALRQWRGPALHGVQSPLVERAALALDRRRTDVVAARAQVRLDLGRHEEVAAELTALVAERPLDEQLRRLLMQALFAGRRRTQALEVFRGGRQALVRELGLEPGHALQELHARALQGGSVAEPAPVPALRPEVPRQLPAGPAAFVGRGAELSRIVALLAGPPDPHTSSPLRVVVVQGAGGVGKSTVAVRAAHELSTRFPDGQLYADLHQELDDRSDVRTGRLLGRFLRALGMADALVPENPDERAAAYRSRLAGKQVLVVLDGVAGAAEVAAAARFHGLRRPGDLAHAIDRAGRDGCRRRRSGGHARRGRPGAAGRARRPGPGRAGARGCPPAGRRLRRPAARTHHRRGPAGVPAGLAPGRSGRPARGREPPAR